MIFSAGFVYRMGIRIKDFGERMVRVPAVRLFCGPVINLGLRVKNLALHSPIGKMN
jgi:hypothetical protein